MVVDKVQNLIHANFFFVDSVGMSNPDMSTKIQLKKIEALQNCIRNCEAYKKNSKENILFVPTGDGMCLGFLQGVDLPLKLAIQLHEKLEKYNQGKIPSEVIRVRIGLHSGNCFTFTDLDGHKNVWGPGIIIAKRVMDIGDDGHILLSSSLAETLMELSDENRKMIRPVRDYIIKHGRPMLIYSAYGKGFGNPITPKKKGYQRSKIDNEIIRLQNTTLYPTLRVDLSLKDCKNMVVLHKRTYEIANLSHEPIRYVLHGIATDVPNDSLDDLKLRIYENSGDEKIRISSVNLDKPFSKEFSTFFEKPILKGEHRTYTIEYEIEEPRRFYENAFSVDCNKFILSFSYEKEELERQPILYEVNQETEEKKRSEITPVVEQINNKTRVTWTANNLVKGQTFRIEW